jgi:ribonucleoside-diphosphate reductase alpha chain
VTTQMSAFAATITAQKYLHDLSDGQKEVWGRGGLATRVATNVLGAVDAPKSLVSAVEESIALREFLPGGRYLYATGRPFHQTQNCLLKKVDDSREGWSEHMQKASMGLMTGAGIGTVYSFIRPEGRPIRKTGGVASGPLSLMKMTNESGRFIQQGGSRRAALWAGLHWNHSDIAKFIVLKDWIPEVRRLKAQDFNFPATMDMTNISVILDDAFFRAYRNENHSQHVLADSVYWQVVRHMLKTGEPGFSIDVGPNAGEHLRNACTEITSFDDDDICNLGSINMARIRDLDHFRAVMDGALAFLIAGTVYSDVPYAAVDRIRTKNRRLGLGLMGVHEWLLVHGKKYGPDAELDRYLEVYATSTPLAARWAKEWDLSEPVKTRAIAPNGTIGIVAETTPSGEPMFCAAYKRRYLKGSVWHAQYVIDPCAARLVKMGIDPDAIEDAYSLAEDVERRVAFQAHLQQYVDHAISSTINLPAWGTEHNNEGTVRPFGEMLMKYLPKLRGITAYPDGARGGQPLNPVRYQTAAKHIGQVLVEGGEPEVAFEQADVCDITKGGTCGA